MVKKLKNPKKISKNLKNSLFQKKKINFFIAKQKN